jgi:hypothetical protein
MASVMGMNMMMYLSFKFIFITVLLDFQAAKVIYFADFSTFAFPSGMIVVTGMWIK